MTSIYIILQIFQLVILAYVVSIVKKTPPVLLAKRLDKLEIKLENLEIKVNEKIEENSETHRSFFDVNEHIVNTLNSLKKTDESILRVVEELRRSILKDKVFDIKVDTNSEDVNNG